MPTAEDVRTEVKSWLEENWDPDLTVAEWWDRLAGRATRHRPSPKTRGGRVGVAISRWS